jgi:HK97 family phage portal protein
MARFPSIARVANAARALFAPAADGTVAKAASGGFNAANSPRNLMSFGYTGGYVPHEPFTQAWQKGLENSGAREPSLLAFSGVYACIAIISQDIAKLPLRLLELLEDGITERVASKSPYHRVLRQPNSYQTSLDFIQFWLVSRLIRGNVYVFQEFDMRGVPIAMHVLHPDRVRVMIEPNTKEIFYQYTPFANDMIGMEKFSGSEGTVMIPARYIIHDRINCLFHPLVGTSPLFAAAVSAAMGGRIMLNTEKLFANMSRPSGLLTSAGEIGDVTAERLKRDFEKNYSAGNIGRTAVLGDGLEWKAMVMTSTDAQLIEQLKWTIEDVARVYRVPMYLLNDVTRMTYKNSEQAQTSYYSGCLQYHIESLESRLTMAFGLDENSQYAGFDVEVMFRMDTKDRYEAYNAGITSGVMSPNEARAKERRGPVKGGEEPRMQMQYVPLSTPIEPKVAPAAAPAPAPVAAPAPTPAPKKTTFLETGMDEDDIPPTPEERREAHLEMLAMMTRVSAGAARARFAYEGLGNE